MTTTHQKKQNDKNTISTVVAGVAGAVAIAGVAVAATMALKDEETRQKVKKVLINVKDQAIDYAEALKTEPNVEEESNKIKHIVTAVKIRTAKTQI